MANEPEYVIDLPAGNGEPATQVTLRVYTKGGEGYLADSSRTQGVGGSDRRFVDASSARTALAERRDFYTREILSRAAASGTVTRRRKHA
jgi:hypothetical protein